MVVESFHCVCILFMFHLLEMGNMCVEVAEV